MDADDLLRLLNRTAEAVKASLVELSDWGLAGTRPGQYRSDLAADAAALRVLLDGGVGVLSEESGVTEADRAVVVVVDPVDGSTNASRALPWYATSLCAVDVRGPVAALVVNQATGERFEAVRGRGARRNGVPVGAAHALAPSPVTAPAGAILALSGYPPQHLGWRQYRAMGASALDLCAVACGVFDGFVDCSRDAHGLWDYLGAWLVCREAGAHMGDAVGRDLVVLDHGARRTPVAAGTAELYETLLAARQSFS